jgi:hypothetical protein
MGGVKGHGYLKIIKVKALRGSTLGYIWEIFKH